MVSLLELPAVQWAMKEPANPRICAQPVNVETWSLQALDASNMERILLLMVVTGSIEALASEV